MSVKTNKIYTCDICKKSILVEDGTFPLDMSNSIELEETFFTGTAHTTKYENVCKDCMRAINQIIAEREDPSDG